MQKGTLFKGKEFKKAKDSFLKSGKFKDAMAQFPTWNDYNSLAKDMNKQSKIITKTSCLTE